MPDTKRLQDQWDGDLEKIFAELVEEGEFEVARRDESGKPIAWRTKKHKRH